MIQIFFNKIYSKSLYAVAFFFLVSFSAFSQDEALIKQGESIFKANCASCHYVTEKRMTGPGLKGAVQRWEENASIEKLYEWIRNSQAVIRSGDVPYANELYAEYNNSVMTAFALTDTEIAAVLEYIQYPPAPPAGEKVAGDTVVAKELSWSDPSVIFMLVVSMILAIIGFLLVRLLGSLRRMTYQAKGQPIPEPIPLYKKLTDKRFLAAASILFVIFLAITAFDVTTKMGRQQNYEPTQPIAFSHKLHAGINGVDCQYCHSGARKGKSAVIPAANVCMNCHKAIEEGPEYGKAEIAKIYEAVDWDVETQTYGDNPKPIEWVRIHNLPDHVYFNHSQHVTVGGVQCQTCHGPIETMEKVYQHETLGMGWCIDCHRETEVNFVSNDYYQVYEQLHKDLKENGKKVTVEDIGGLECQKCHY